MVSGNERPPYFMSPFFGGWDFVERHGTQEVVEIRYSTPQKNTTGKNLTMKRGFVAMMGVKPPPSTRLAA